MIFLDIKFPEDISSIAESGPNFLTNILSSSSGKEFRNSKLLKPFMKYSINYSKLSRSMMENLLSFFYIVRGRGFSFRFKDFCDFEANLILNHKLNLKNFLVISNDVEFENEKWAFLLSLQKNYILNKSNDLFNKHLYDHFFQRRITKPISSSLKFWEKDKEIPLENFSTRFKLDDKLGNLYLKDEIDLKDFNITFEFDVCVRFGSDYLKISNFNPGIFDAEKIELLEVFE